MTFAKNIKSTWLKAAEIMGVDAGVDDTHEPAPLADEDD